MNSVILLIGGNEGNRTENIYAAKALIGDRIGKITEFSSCYESEPWGFAHQQNFLNQVVEVSTTLLALDILNLAKQIEKELGRKPKTQAGYEGRTMDIDILFFNNEIIELPQLTVPHPKIQERRFTLLPLAERWGKLVHPILGKTMNMLLNECDDAGWVRKIKAP